MRLADRGRKAAVISWATFLVALVLFVLAAMLTPETGATRAEHYRVSAQWQQVQIDKGAGSPPYRPRAHWKDTPVARTLERWDHATDVRINRWWANRFFDHVMPFFTDLGYGHWQALFLIGVWLVAWRKRRRDWQITAALGIAGLILSIVTQVVKHLVPRSRPPTLDPYNTIILVHPLYASSFPSGHALSSFAIATVIARRHPWTAPWAFGLAAIIGLSRISVGVHWPLDVIGGAILGILIGWLVTAWWDRREQAKLSEFPS